MSSHYCTKSDVVVSFPAGGLEPDGCIRGWRALWQSNLWRSWTDPLTTGESCSCFFLRSVPDVLLLCLSRLGCYYHLMISRLAEASVAQTSNRAVTHGMRRCASTCRARMAKLCWNVRRANWIIHDNSDNWTWIGNFMIFLIIEHEFAFPNRSQALQSGRG